jgi:tellurite methyltransferase
LNKPSIEKWNLRYEAGEQLFKLPVPLVVDITRNLRPGLALDLASGPGRNALYLADLGWRVTALDGSPIAIELLLGRARERNLAVEAKVIDLEAGELEIPVNTFDLVLSSYYFERGLIPQIKSALRPGGLAIMIVLVADADQPQGTPARAYPGELGKFFEGWMILHYREDQPGESWHQHTAVAEIVARKPA